MSDDHETMDEARLSALLDAYGAETGRFPEAERAAAERLLSTSAQARKQLDRARQLDTLLTAASGHEPSASLQRQVAEIPVRHPHAGYQGAASWQSFVPFGSLWRAALAAAFAVGLGVMGGIADSTPEPDAGVAQLDAEWAELEALAFADGLEGALDADAEVSP